MSDLKPDYVVCTLTPEEYITLPAATVESASKRGHIRRAAPEPAPSDVEPLLQRARNWIEAIDVRYGPSHYSLAAEFARVRAEERERCARVCEEVENEKKGIGSKVAWDFGHGAGIAAAAIRKREP